MAETGWREARRAPAVKGLLAPSPAPPWPSLARNGRGRDAN